MCKIDEGTKSRGLASALAVNALCLLALVFATYALVARAGYAPTVAFARSNVAGVVTGAAFWVAACASWPLSLLCLWKSGAIAGAAGPPRNPFAAVLAWLEVAAWALIWAGFAAVFLPAIICGLR